MIMTRLDELQDAEAHSAAKAWFERFEAAFAGDTADVEQARATLAAHVIEAIEADPAASPSRVNEALDRLGPPEALAREWSGPAPELTPTWLQWVRAGAVSMMRALAGVLSAVFAFAALGRLADPDIVGLFAMEEGGFLLGTPSGKAVEADLLGGFTAPVFLAVSVALAAAVWFTRRRSRQP
ncbi:MAG: hypothetical protein RIA71_14840 [Oceanicaulis sp.]